MMTFSIASTNARSVFGLMGYHSSDFCAVTVKRGSRQMSRAFRSWIDSIRSMVSGVINDSSRLAPARTTYFALYRSNDGTVPNVIEYARFTDARHSVGWRTIFGEPSAM